MNEHAEEGFLTRDRHGRLLYTDQEGQQHVAQPIRAFPLSSPREGIALCDAAGRELLWIELLDDLPPEQRSLLEEALARREFVPVLQRIVRVSAPAEPSEWEVETDRGPTRFVLNSEDDVHRLDGDRALIKDAQGLRYLIADLRSWTAPADATSNAISEQAEPAPLQAVAADRAGNSWCWRCPCTGSGRPERTPAP